MAVLENAVVPLEAGVIAARACVSPEIARGALSSMLRADLIHVADEQRCRGGRRFFYRAGPAPLLDSKVSPHEEALLAMQAAARANGSIHGRQR